MARINFYGTGHEFGAKTVMFTKKNYEMLVAVIS